MNAGQKGAFEENRQSLWVLTLSPAIWAAHFLLSYISAAIVCGTAVDPARDLGPLRISIVVLSVLALAGIVFVGWRGHRKQGHATAEATYDHDSPEDRHRFLGYATVLLSGLSAIAVIYSTLSAILVRSCY